MRMASFWMQVLDGEPIATKGRQKMPEAEKWDNELNFTEFVRNYHIQLNEAADAGGQATEGPVLLLCGSRKR